MIINEFILNGHTQPILFGFSLLLLTSTLVFYAFKFIKKNILNHQRLTLLDKRLEDANSLHLQALDGQKMQLEATDPLEEAKIFACYGKFDQAIKILKWQIKAFPKEIVPYTELFIIYIHQEDEVSYYKLLEVLPFDKNSSEYQGFVANAKLSFPNHSIDKSQSIKKSNADTAQNNRSASAPSSATLLGADKKANSEPALSEIDKTIAKKSVVSHRKSINQQPLIIIKSKVPCPINRLSSLEQSIFYAFKGNSTVQNSLMKRKMAYKKAQNAYKKNQLKHKKLPLLRVKKHSDLLKKNHLNGIQENTIKKFKELMLAKNELNGIHYLEQEIKQNPLREKLYPLLMQSYIELQLLDRYLAFRKEIFSHTIQPGIDIILLITDAETRLSLNQTKLKQVA
jgi:hypothetical protein